MRIYVASSWKNKEKAKGVAIALRGAGHKVDCFCDPENAAIPGASRYVFDYRELEQVGNPNLLDQFAIQQNSRIVRRAFEEDAGWIEWAEAVVLVLPAGKSAHLEAGYAKGLGKHLFILGDFPPGELDVMYLFADSIHRELEGLIAAVNEKAIA